jgi:hypothetical protein
MLIMTSPYYYLINPPVISSALPTHEPWLDACRERSCAGVRRAGHLWPQVR